jgi:hypothetical protein
MDIPTNLRTKGRERRKIKEEGRKGRKRRKRRKAGNKTEMEERCPLRSSPPLPD